MTLSLRGDGDQAAEQRDVLEELDLLHLPDGRVLDLPERVSRDRGRDQGAGDHGGGCPGEDAGSESGAGECLNGGVAADDDTGKVFRPNTGSINLTKEPIRSNENRRDGQMTRGRHGSRSVAGQYSGDLSLGSYDDLIEAVFRGTFEDALVIDDATAAMNDLFRSK